MFVTISECLSQFFLQLTLFVRLQGTIEREFSWSSFDTNLIESTWLQKRMELRILSTYGDRFVFRNCKQSRHFLITYPADPDLILHILATGVARQNRQISIFLCRRQDQRSTVTRLTHSDTHMVDEFVHAILRWLWESSPLSIIIKVSNNGVWQ